MRQHLNAIDFLVVWSGSGGLCLCTEKALTTADLFHLGAKGCGIGGTELAAAAAAWFTIIAGINERGVRVRVKE